jgi:D-alanyl-D-alanine carboxypeptidase/D-alanyl-D-alanine-endopeptidase (penicillin-binding protein 4)
MTLPPSAFSRRWVLGALLAGAAPGALAEPLARSLRPPPRPDPTAKIPKAEDLVARVALSGKLGFAVADVATGELLEVRNPLLGLPPASVTKSLTALYALDALGPDYRFVTRVIATGPLVNGRIEGDLVLEGGGDPTLDTDMLGELAGQIKAAGVRELRGRFLYDHHALPDLPLIDPEQPPHVGYNPAISGLNLNYNRVHFEWRRTGARYDVSMDARATRYSPEVSVARMQVVNRAAPIYTYSSKGGVDEWTVARDALGNAGARWLPVRRPALYCAEVFQTLARAHGIVLPSPEAGSAPAEGTVLARRESAPLSEILRDMLKYSTNMTAEVVGLSASIARGLYPLSLAESGQRMSDWLGTRMGARKAQFVDHSGLGGASRISAVEMVRALVEAAPDGQLKPLLKTIPMRDAKGRPLAQSPAEIHAKTGTLNFVSALAGYITPPNGRELAFAIFSADEARRDSLTIQQRDRPEGGHVWIARARRLQRELIERWVTIYV